MYIAASSLLLWRCAVFGQGYMCWCAACAKGVTFQSAGTFEQALHERELRNVSRGI
jgi:hypothetical protein